MNVELSQEANNSVPKAAVLKGLSCGSIQKPRAYLGEKVVIGEI